MTSSLPSRNTARYTTGGIFYSTEIMEMFSTLIVFGDRLKMSNIDIRY